MAALYNRKTKPGCEESIQSAMQAASSHQQQYLQKEWWNTRADWAHYARCYSALLLQVPSTNAVESWHASLKFNVKKEMRQWSLLGLVKHLSNIAVQWDRKAAKTASEFRSKHLSDTVYWPGMRKLPYPIQQLRLGEQERALDLITQGAQPTRSWADDLTCDCSFFSKVTASLCRHVDTRRVFRRSVRSRSCVE